MTTMLDYKTTLAYLAYLGYDNGPTRDAIKIIYPNRLTSKKGGNNNNRNVFHAYVFGATGSGKVLIYFFVFKYEM
jgi:Ras family protein T1